MTTLVGLALGAAVAVAWLGADLARKTHDGFRTPRQTQTGTLQSRLFSSSGHDRVAYWRVAWKEYSQHPLLGSGAGTFELYWARDRPTAAGSRFAHNLYLQELAELGPLALILLAIALGAPFVALRTARRLPLVPAAAGAYAAGVAHAALDWDWQLPTVMLGGLLAGAAILVGARGAIRPAPRSQRGRVACLCIVAALGALAGTGWIGNRTLALSAAALGRGNYQDAAARARAARPWQPWASEPWRELGLAEMGLGRLDSARAGFLHAVARDRLDWQTWYDLARASHGVQRAVALKEAQRLNPLGPEAHMAPPTG